jgi:hypothetical protein
VTRWVCEKRPKCSPADFLLKWIHYIFRAKNKQKMLAIFAITGQRKNDCPNGRKSGHPVLHFFCTESMQKRRCTWFLGSATPSAFPPPPRQPPFSIILFLSTDLLTGMTGNSLHVAVTPGFSVAWQLFFVVTDQTPRPLFLIILQRCYEFRHGKKQESI